LILEAAGEKVDDVFRDRDATGDGSNGAASPDESGDLPGDRSNNIVAKAGDDVAGNYGGNDGSDNRAIHRSDHVEQSDDDSGCRSLAGFP
jgi:hypothetical protein